LGKDHAQGLTYLLERVSVAEAKALVARNGDQICRG
jgi:hypothetical protein